MTILDIVAEPVDNEAYFTFTNCSTCFRIDLFGQIDCRSQSGMFLPMPATRSWLKREDFYWCDQDGNRFNDTAVQKKKRGRKQST